MGMRGSVAIFVGACVLAAAPGGAGADGPWLELTPLVGYQFGGSFEGDRGKVDFGSSANFGGLLGWRIRDDGLVVVGYQRQRSRARFRSSDPNNPGSDEADVDIGYLQFGGELEFHTRPYFVPLLGLTIGATHFTPRRSELGSEWFFSGSVYTGAKFPLTKYFGLRSQIRMFATLIDGNSSIFCVAGGGAACVISLDTSGMIQGDVTAGVYVSF